MPHSVTLAKVRLYVEADLAHATEFAATGGRAYYMINVVRLKPGDRLLLFNGRDGEWWGHIETIHKGGFTLIVDEQTKVQAAGPDRIRFIHPDCGFWMLKRSIADRKIAALAEGRDLYLGR